MYTINLTNDSKAILLLCGHFGKNDAVKPFTLKDYNRLTDWLQDKGIRPADLLSVDISQLLASLPPDIDEDRVKRLLERGAAMALAVEKWTGSGVWVVCRSDADYPSRLKKHLKKQAPPLLYGVGLPGLLEKGGLAVVGSRNVDVSGEQFTRKAAAACVDQGIQIVSGGARGVDQLAMIEALDCGGTIVGVLADSLSKSAVQKKYRDAIREHRLTLISAFSPDARFSVGNAMGRNKYIYALADFALVIAAEAEKGGTWNGAAEELKRKDACPVFVRDEPGAPEGNRALMKLGAQPFPKPPWKDNLTAKLLKQRSKIRPTAGEQLSMFQQMPTSSATAAMVKEKLADYPKEEIKVNGTSGKEPPKMSESFSSIYDAVLPVLLNALQDWQKPDILVKKLGIRKPQLDDWLKRAVDEKRIKKKTRPVQYRRLS